MSATLTHKKKNLSGNNMEEIIKDTLRVLCSNSVSYGSKISINALIGITVDDSEVILVNIQDQLKKVASDGPGVQHTLEQSGFSGHPVKQEMQRSSNDADFWQQSASATVSNYLSEFADGNYDAGAGEARDLNDYFSEVDNNGDYAFNEAEDQQYTDEFGDGVGYGDDQDYFGNFDAAMPYANAGGDIKPFQGFEDSGLYLPQQRQPKPQSKKRVPLHSTAARRGKSGTTNTARKQTKINTKPEAFSFGETGAQSTEIATSSAGLLPNEKSTVYTCSICGEVLRHLQSFLRHKQKHEGVVFRCDLCGTVLSRRDVLQAHRRKCEAKFMQQQSQTLQ